MPNTLILLYEQGYTQGIRCRVCSEQLDVLRQNFGEMALDVVERWVHGREFAHRGQILQHLSSDAHQMAINLMLQEIRAMMREGLGNMGGGVC